MVQKFSNGESTFLYRAPQLWQILIGKAHNRQTTTYIELARMIGYGGASPVSSILGYIMNYCNVNELPPLTILVVNQGTGAPGHGLTTIEELNADREKVFNYDWYDLIPPSLEDYQNASNS